VFEDNPLICREKNFDKPIIGDELSGNVYFGTGFVTPKAITNGLPFDFLGFLLSAEHIRRETGAEKIIHLLADEHARVSKPSNDHPLIDQRVSEVSQSIKSIVKNIGLEDSYELIMASDLSKDKRYLEIYDEVTLDDQDIHEAAVEYVRRQIADMAYMHQYRNTDIKLSWLIDPKAKKIGFDERFFDSVYERVRGSGLSFVYTGPGRSMLTNRPKASPYVLTEKPEDRLNINSSPAEVEKYFDRIESRSGRVASGVHNHLENIVKVYENLNGSLNGNNLCEKIQNIVSICTGLDNSPIIHKEQRLNLT